MSSRVPAGERSELSRHDLGRFAHDVAAAAPADGAADPREEQAQVIVDFSRRADGRPWVADAVLLSNRDRRADALDRVDVRLLHPLEKLPGIGRQRLDIAALALGVDRVEGERRLARPAHPGHDDQRPLGDGQIDILEVVRAGTADDDIVPGLTSGCHLRCALLRKPQQSIVAHPLRGFNLELDRRSAGPAHLLPSCSNGGRGLSQRDADRTRISVLDRYGTRIARIRKMSRGASPPDAPSALRSSRSNH